MEQTEGTWKRFAGCAVALLVLATVSTALAASPQPAPLVRVPPVSSVPAEALRTTLQPSPQILQEEDPLSRHSAGGSTGQQVEASSSEIEVLSFSVNNMKEYSWWTEYVSISGGNSHFEDMLLGDDVVLDDYGESVCENLIYNYSKKSYGSWDRLQNYTCVDNGLPYDVKHTTRLSLTFSRVGNTTEYNHCSIFLEYINVTIKHPDGNLSYGYHSQGMGNMIGNWSGNTFTASWDFEQYYHYKGNLTVTLSQQPGPKPLVVTIEYPGNGFVARTTENVTIAAKVTDGQNNTITGSNLDSVTASFTTNAQRAPPNLYLYDDGAHDDGSKDDGLYANVWAPDQTGDYTITVTATKSGLLDGVETVTGIVIATPALEIPAQFKHVHPYKDDLGGDAPVFQRGVENPQFKISNLTGARPTGVNLVIEILRFLEPIAKNVTVTESWSATPILVEWDWSTNAGPRTPSDIPVGMYIAKAKLVESSTNAILEESYPEYFYVIFNYPWGREYVTSPKGVVYSQYKNASLGYETYPLHQYNATLWKWALLTVDGRTNVKDASTSLRLLAYEIGGRGNNYPANPQRGQNAWWFNGGTLTFLEKGSGVCVDYAALMTAYCRAVGIPAEVISAYGMEGNQLDWSLLWAHAWVEIQDDSWYWYEPTYDQRNYPWPLGGTYGTDLYATKGVEFRPRPRYFVGAPPLDGSGPINVYDRYTFCADVWNFTFTNAPPAGYDYGQPVQCNVTVANWGSITISRPLNVSIYEDVIGGLSLTSQFPLRLDRGDKVIANTLDSSRFASESFSWTLPDFGQDSSFYERVYERYVNVVVYYRDNEGRKIQTDSYKKRIPGLCISPLPLITVDGERRALSNATYSYMDHADERSWKTETFVLDVPAVVRTRTEHEAAENYSQAVVSIENPDTATHNYTFSLQLAGRGDALYLPALGSITANCTGLNISTNYLLSYDQTNGTGDFISIHEFSQNVTIEDIEFIEYKGVRGMLINGTWNLPGDRHSSQDFAIYYSRRLGGGLSFSEIHTALAEEIVDHGDSLSTLRIAPPGQCRVGDAITINVTIFNNGVTSETINVTLNVTKDIEIVPYTTIGLYNGTVLTTVSPQTGTNVTFVVAVPEPSASGVWDIKAETDKGLEATGVFNVEDAFDLTCTSNISVPQCSPFTFNATVTNTWDTAVHDVNVTLDLFFGIHTSDPAEKLLGTLSPGERRTVSWDLNATAPGELPLEVVVTSSDGGFDRASAILTSLAPPKLWVPNVIARTTNPDSGTAKTLLLNATMYNLGDLPAPDVQIQLILPENVTSPALTQDLGDLSGGEHKNVSFNITFDTQSDFAFAVVASADGNRSAIGTVMVALLGPALPDLTLTGDDIRFIPALSNSSLSAAAEPAVLFPGSEHQKRLKPLSLKPSSVQARALENLPRAPDITAPTAAEPATYEGGYSGENPLRTGEIKIASPGSIASSFTIYDLTYPSTAKSSRSFQVVVDTAYTFETSTPVYVGIWDYDAVDYLTDTETTLIGLGSARFTLNLTAPASGMLNLSADLWYWDGFDWVWSDSEDFTITITEERILSIENVTFPATVNSNQTFQVVVNANYSFDTVTYVYAGIWDYNLSGYIAGTSGADTLVGTGTVPFSFNVTAPSAGVMHLAAALSYWDWDASDWLLADFQDFMITVTGGEPDFTLAADPSVQTVAAGANTSYIVSMTALNGFTLPVTLLISGLPNGVTAVFQQNPVIPPNSSTLTLSTATTTPPGVYTLTITGGGGAITRNTTVSLNVTEKSVAILTATVHNIGWAEASNVVLQFFDGNPDSGGIRIGEDQTIASIAAGGTGSADVCWDITEEVGAHVMYVRIDPNNAIAELNEANNFAFRQLGVPGVRCADPAVTINRAKTSVTDDPVGEGYNLSDAPANVNILNAKGFTLTATGPNGTYPFNITFSSPVGTDFVLFKLPGWIEIPYTILDTFTIQVHLEISDGVLDPAFVLATVRIFETGSGSYPSVSGTHNGTIRPDQTLSLSTLYTYPCAGTGGHTEYVKIWNSTGRNITAMWSGYTGDWQNITFTTTFTLYANETYNYTIRTGSYPQIIHEPSWNAIGGVITCTEFVDVNGKRHEGWIPAIRLS